MSKNKIFFLCALIKAKTEVHNFENVQSSTFLNKTIKEFIPNSYRRIGLVSPKILFENQLNNKKIIDTYFSFKDLITSEARFFLLKHKYKFNNSEQNKYDYYNEKVENTRKKIKKFMKNNEYILDNFNEIIKNFHINLDNGFFNIIYSYAKKIDELKKTKSMDVYLKNKQLDEKNQIEQTLLNIEKIKKENIERVDKFYTNQNQKLPKKYVSTYKKFHKLVEKLCVSQSYINSLNSVEYFKENYNKATVFFRKYKTELLNMKKGLFASEYCNDYLLFSTYSINLMLEYFTKVSMSAEFIIDKKQIPEVINKKDQLIAENNHNNEFIKTLIESASFLKNHLI